MTEVFLPPSPAMTWTLKWLLHACPSPLFSKTARKARSVFKCFLWIVRAFLLKTLQPCSLFPRRPCSSGTCQPSQLPRSALPSHQAPATLSRLYSPGSHLPSRTSPWGPWWKECSTLYCRTSFGSYLHATSSLGKGKVSLFLFCLSWGNLNDNLCKLGLVLDSLQDRPQQDTFLTTASQSGYFCQRSGWHVGEIQDLFIGWMIAKSGAPWIFMTSTWH